jgi:hypothetical protein
MAALLAARRQDLAAARRLHARAEAMRLCPAPPAWLKCALWQNNPPFSEPPQSDPSIIRSRSERQRLQPRSASFASRPFSGASDKPQSRLALNLLV